MKAKRPALTILLADLVRIEPADRPEEACGVLEVRLSDGRQFSVLTATPAWFSRAFAERGLQYYYGASVLFLRRMDPELAREAAAKLAEDDGRFLCLYDTPRTTLPETLDRFRATH